MVGVVYNPSDKSFECSASDGSQWIETYIPNGSRFNTQFSVSVWANMGQFDITSLYGFIFALGDRNQTGLSSTSGNEISLVYNHAGLTEGTFFAGLEGQNIIFKEWTTHNSHMGQWYHLTMTYDGSTLYVYKNGENSGYATRTAPVLPDDNCVVRLFGDAVNENATHQGVQSRISNFKLYDCCLTRDEVRTLYGMGRCDEGHHVVSFEKTRAGIGLGDGCAPKAELDVRGRVRIGPSGQQWRTSGDDGDRLLQFHSGQAASGQPTLEVTHYGGTRVSPTPTVLQISNELGGGSDWSTTEPYGMLSFANGDGSGSGVAGPAASVGAVCDSVSGGGDTRLAFFTNSGISHLERMCVNHDGNVGIGTTSPGYFFHAFRDAELYGNNNDEDTHLSLQQAGQMTIQRKTGSTLKAQINSNMSSNSPAWIYYKGSTNYWRAGYSATNPSGSTSNDFKIQWLTSVKAYVDASDGTVEINFTGQHRTFIDGVPTSESGDFIGLIVSADKNKYMKMSKGVEMGSNAITINESLPLVSLSTIAHDKACFGVISDAEDSETRKDSFGSLVTVSKKELGDTRVYINSVGEGAIWVTNINGPLESGDYITTSNVVGYGQKQDSEFLANYTVAKITMDCDFDPVTQPIQQIKKDETGENILDEHGQIQWEDHPTETEPAYKIRYLDADGNITDEANAVHTAAFVGCTYHCG